MGTDDTSMIGLGCRMQDLGYNDGDESDGHEDDTA